MATRRSGALVQRSKPAESNKNEVDPAIDVPEDDDNESETKETRLTLMEEILLLGLKDREVSPLSIVLSLKSVFRRFTGFYRVCFVFNRGTRRFGMTVFRPAYVAAF